MSFKITFALSILVSIAAPVVFLLLYGNGGTAVGARSSAYATIIIDDKQDDREICRLLDAHNVRNYLSASNQWAFLNDFNEVKKLPLDEYFNKIEDYDLRNDGYAQKALSVFQSNGEKRIFIPTEELNSVIGDPRTVAAMILGKTPYKALDINYSPKKNTSGVLVFLLACVLLIGFALKGAVQGKPVFARPRMSDHGDINGANGLKGLNGLNGRLPVKRVRARGARLFNGIVKANRFKIFYVVALIPDFAIMAKFGAAGFALCALMLTLLETLRKPLIALLGNVQQTHFDLAGHPGSPGNKARGGPVSTKELMLLFDTGKNRTLFQNFMNDLFFISPLILIFIAICIAGQIDLVALLFFLAFFFLSFFSILYCELQSSKFSGHSSFMRIPIFSKKRLPAKYPLLPLPFLFAAAIELAISFWTAPLHLGARSVHFVPPQAPANSMNYANAANLPDEAAYKKHYEFQKNFSYLNINSDFNMEFNNGEGGDGEGGEPYLRYTAGANGLVRPEGVSSPDIAAPDLPDFPLTKLVLFLNNPESTAVEVTQAPPLLNSLLTLLFAFSIYLPFILQNKKKRQGRAAFGFAS